MKKLNELSCRNNQNLIVLSKPNNNCKTCNLSFKKNEDSFKQKLEAENKDRVKKFDE